MKQELIEYLSQFVTEERLKKFKEVVQNRTRYLTTVLEDIYQSHNASAVLRSCDCFGIQDVHIIENKNKYNINPDVALGSSKWLDLKKYNKKEFNTDEAIKSLRKNNYRIIATVPSSDATELDSFDLTKGKAAIFFGTELTGLTETVIKNADEYLKIPMYGFTESFNISVSAAIIMYELTKKLKTQTPNWQLNKKEKNNLLLQWLKASIKNADALEKNYVNKKNKQNSHFLNK